MNESENCNKIILASASPRRRQLMEEAGIPFEAAPSGAREIDCLPPRELVLENARLKAMDAAEKFPERLVLGADTTVALNGKIFGKPKDPAEAAQMLQTLQGKTHSVWTGVCLAKKSGGKIFSKCAAEESKVGFKKLGGEEIAEYLQKVYVLDKAGAYAAQECGEMIIEKIDGAFDNVMGLPMRTVKNLLDTADF